MNTQQSVTATKARAPKTPPIIAPVFDAKTN